MMSTSGNIMSTAGDVQYIGVFNKNQKSLRTCSPHESRYSPDVLNTHYTGCLYCLLLHPVLILFRLIF